MLKIKALAQQQKLTQQFESIFLRHDDFSSNCAQPTNDIELEELAFPLQSKVFLE